MIKLFCDLDGVLVDFNKGYYNLTGIDLNGKEFQNSKEFWKPIDKAGIKFWENLEWMPDGKKLWKNIKYFNPILLSAPSSNYDSHKGKIKWVERELPGVSLVLKKAKEKHLIIGDFPDKDCVLIDDRLDTCNRWDENGGFAIHHTNTNDTLSCLNYFLIELFK